MRCLFDANSFLWWNLKSNRLSQNAYAVIEDETNIILLSLVTIWEIQIKVQLGKLTLQNSLVEIIEKMREEQIEFLPINIDHILKLGDLPYHHRDPFDRLLIAQSLAERIPVISSDSLFAQYGVNVIW
jgi:PIN domain nuclease of toxin-antitoxin system